MLHDSTARIRCLTSLLVLTLQASTSMASGDELLKESALRKTAQRIHASAILVDGHNDITLYMADTGYDLSEPSAGLFHTDLNRLRQGGVGAVFFSLWIDPAKYGTNGAAGRALHLLDSVYAAVEKHPRDLVLASSVADIRRAKRQGRIAALMGIEGGYAIEDSLANLRAFYRLGVRYMTLTHTRSTSWAGATTNGPGNGLTDFGRAVVGEMNRLGMLVDVSHVSDATMHDVLDVARVPVIASHSSARALFEHPRNVPDQLLRRIAANGGVVMVNFYNGFLDTNYTTAFSRIEPEYDAIWARHANDLRAARAHEQKLMASVPPVPLTRLIEHIEHIIKVAGIDHVGLGSDFDGVECTPAGMEDVSCYPNLTVELLRRGHGKRDIEKILGENFLRVFAEAERFAVEAKATR